jgi:hypothetical protein
MYDPLRVQIAQSPGDIQSHLVILPPEDGGVCACREGCIARVQETLQVHLAKFSRDEDADVFIEGQFLWVGQRRGIGGGT